MCDVPQERPLLASDWRGRMRAPALRTANRGAGRHACRRRAGKRRNEVVVRAQRGYLRLQKVWPEARACSTQMRMSRMRALESDTESCMSLVVLSE